MVVKNCANTFAPGASASGDNTSTQIGMTVSGGKAFCLHTGKHRGFGVTLSPLLRCSSRHAERLIRAYYMEGVISKSELIRSIATHAVSVGGARSSDWSESREYSNAWTWFCRAC